MVKAFFAIALAALLALVGVAATKPDEWVVTRSAVINAPAAKLFAQINDLNKWANWSPWAKLDPAQKATFTGPKSGKDSSMKWESANDEVGVGTMTITESKPNEKITMRLDFEKPMPATNTTEFTFKPVDKGTQVTWTMQAHATIVTKIMGVIFNCDKIVGDMFDKGLVNLKEVVEK